MKQQEMHYKMDGKFERIMVHHLRITLLADNSVYRKKLLAEHGLSIFLEADGKRILFDTGQGFVALRNAETLGISLRGLDAVVLSHGHYDHTGSLAEVISRFIPAAVYLHPAAVAPKFSRKAGAPHRPIGMPADARQALERYSGKVFWTTTATEIVPGLWCTGEVPRPMQTEQALDGLFLDEACTVRDSVLDDQSIYVQHTDGVVAITGCSHSGLGNTLERICTLSGREKLQAVIGGFHLGGASPERLEAVAVVLEQRACRLVAPCHCTGVAASGFLRQRLGSRVQESGVGAQFDFEG